MAPTEQEQAHSDRHDNPDVPKTRKFFVPLGKVKCVLHETKPD